MDPETSILTMPRSHPHTRRHSPLENLEARELHELIDAANGIFSGMAGFTGAVLSQVSKKAGRRLTRACGHLGKLIQHSSSGGRILGKALTSWYRGVHADEFGFDPTLAEAVRPLFQFIYQEYFRVDAKGAESVPLEGPALLVANHSGAIPYDATMLSCAVLNELPRQRYVRFLVDDFVPELPVIGKFMERLGSIRATHDNAMRLLAAGHLVAVFPEGIKGIEKPFEQRYQLQRFGRGGFIRLAMRTGVPIIPIAIVGAEEIAPVLWTSETLGRPLGMPYVPFTLTFPWLGPLGLIPLPVKWKIFFGKAIDYGRFEPADAENYDLVQQESGRVRGEVQKLLARALAARPSIWMD